MKHGRHLSLMIKISSSRSSDEEEDENVFEHFISGEKRPSSPGFPHVKRDEKINLMETSRSL
jgi:hypothetical protein